VTAPAHLASKQANTWVSLCYHPSNHLSNPNLNPQPQPPTPTPDPNTTNIAGALLLPIYMNIVVQGVIVFLQFMVQWVFMGAMIWIFRPVSWLVSMRLGWWGLGVVLWT